jgi:polyhydroxybutyrate depolymerase
MSVHANMPGPLAWIGVSALALASCCRVDSPDATGSTDTTTATRPYAWHAPRTAKKGVPTPLVVVLCGYDSDGSNCERFFRWPALAESEGVAYLVLDGTRDAQGHRFWNATDACCNKHGATVDDVAYVRSVLDEVASRHAIDPRRVFLFGFSNGGFFAHRLACDMPERFAAIASMAGSTWADPSRCTPTQPVSVLEIRGDADPIVPFAGGRIPFDGGGPPGVLPSARDTAWTWAVKNFLTTGTTCPATEFDAKRKRRRVDELMVRAPFPSTSTEAAFPGVPSLSTARAASSLLVVLPGLLALIAQGCGPPS